MPYYKIDNVTPVVHPEAYVHPTAILIGDVIIGKDCYVGPGASLRGDFGRITMEEGSNLQDNCVIHGFADSHTIIRKHGHVGHGAVLHGCIIGEDALIGMNSVIMDYSEIGSGSIVAAASFVKNKFTCPDRSLVMGSPGKVVRSVTDDELKWKQAGTQEYIELSKRCLASMVECIPLNDIEPNRKTLPTSQHQPKK
ncbi:phenylacetic acid degradation protein PaaY [Marinomonas epiphytica]